MSTTEAPAGAVTLTRGKHKLEMSPLAHQFLVKLLDHQREHRLPGDSYQPGKIDLRLISYSHLCRLAQAGTPQSTGGPLGEIHRWCALNHWPPLDALVVDATTRRPGGGYPDNHHWERDAYAALLFQYPKEASQLP